MPARLVIEVDGGVHEVESVAVRDAEREAWIRRRGYRVLRVSNDEVMRDMELVLERILDGLGGDTPTPTPPRKGEGLIRETVPDVGPKVATGPHSGLKEDMVPYMGL